MATASHQLPTSRNRTAFVYALMLLASAGGLAAIIWYGQSLYPTIGSVVGPVVKGTAEATPPAHSSAMLHVLLALAAVVMVGQLLGRAFKFFGQPAVIGEVLGGILLGPSLLGQVAPDFANFLLPQSVAPMLGMIAQLGVILYMFTVGLELDASLLRERGHATLVISHASIIAPFLLGAALALLIYDTMAEPGVPFLVFTLFLGVSMSVTAFPVLARILTDRQTHRSPLGVMALTCAAVDDATAWCLLALVVGVARAEMGGALLVGFWTALYVGGMFMIARPWIARWIRRYEEQPITAPLVGAILVLLLLSAAATEAIGIHAIFGAFLLGAIMPPESKLAQAMAEKLQDIVSVLLLPAFFAFTGMRTQIGLVQGMNAWLLCGLIILLATAGKFGGTLAAARFSGMPWRDSAALGVLMNTRGLMELIVLNIGLDLGVISPQLFAMLVLMALVTTIGTTPVLQWLTRGRKVDASFV